MKYNNLSYKVFIRLLTKHGINFLIDYINNANVDQTYKKRILRLKLLFKEFDINRKDMISIWNKIDKDKLFNNFTNDEIQSVFGSFILYETFKDIDNIHIVNITNNFESKKSIYELYKKYGY